MEIKKNTLVVLSLRGEIVPGLVASKNLDNSFAVNLKGRRLRFKEGALVPIAQTDGSIQDPEEAFKAHFQQVIMNIAHTIGLASRVLL